MDLSRCRQKLKEVTVAGTRLLPAFMSRRPLVKGGVYQAKTKCGKKGCKCEREGQLHLVWRFYSTARGRPTIRTLKKKDVLKYKSFTESYQRFRRARARLVKIHREQMELVNRLEEGMTKKKL